MKFVQATEADLDFVTEAVFAAVKSGTNVLSYATLFEKSEEELKPLFRDMIEEDIEGQELWLSGFLIAKTDDGIPAATCCAWVEGEEGASSMLTAQVLSFGLGQEVYQKALEKHEIIESLRVDRTEGTLQFEHVYTALEFRGKGLAKQVIEKQIEQYKVQNSELTKAEIILFKTNESALKAYQKLGFETTFEQHSQHPEILNYFPADTRVLMNKDI